MRATIAYDCMIRETRAGKGRGIWIIIMVRCPRRIQTGVAQFRGNFNGSSR
jgi:hypothetical protein